jgi:DNA-binding NtrC family response regulator
LGTAADAESLRILLISDNESFRAEVAAAFETDNHHVHAFRTPEEAWAALPIANLDVGVFDYTFSGRDQTGLELADRLHAADRHFPIIVTSCHWTPHLGAECGRRWATFCIPKCSDPATIVALAREFAREARPFGGDERLPAAEHAGASGT